MYYKPDWPQAKERFLAFWDRQVVDRCCMAVYAPRKSSKLPPFPELQHGAWLGGLDQIPDDDQEAIERWWTDPEANYQRAVLWFENTYFGGEALPASYVDWGASAMAAFYGSRPVFGKHSVWYPEVIEDWDGWEWHFDPETNPWWQAILAIVECFVERNDESYMVGSPELGPAADILTLMRGTDKLCLDLLDYPQQVGQGVDVLSDCWVDIMEQVHTMTLEANYQGGILAWLSLWSPGRHDQIACDFSTVISPPMFREFFVPEIEKEGDWCDYATYHLDGPVAMRHHLDTLLEIEQIDNIQFTPGVGQLPTYTPEYIPVYRKVQESGRCLTLLAQPQEVESLLEQLSPEGLFIITNADSEEEADRLLDRAGKWSASGSVFPSGA